MTTSELRGLVELAALAEQCSSELGPAVSKAVSILGRSVEGNGKILVCGNGGSAADAQHFVAELVGRFFGDAAPLAAISLSSDPSITTAISNDFGYPEVFARQIQALGQPGDAVVFISTSGQSQNILQAVAVARKLELKTIALLGNGGDQVFDLCDVAIHVPSTNAQRIQEIHTAILHSFCEMLESYREVKS